MNNDRITGHQVGCDGGVIGNALFKHNLLLQKYLLFGAFIYFIAFAKALICPAIYAACSFMTGSVKWV